MTTSTCRKCKGTGYLPHFARTDAGRCWSCQDTPQPTAETLADDETYRAEIGAGMSLAERSALRRERRTVR